MAKHASLLALCGLVAGTALADSLPRRDIGPIFDAAEAAGEVGVARKTKPVDARPASPGEVIVTVIAGDGVETRSKPAKPGDMVVRNRCPETGNEEYLVPARGFAARYEGPIGEPDTVWREYHPVAPDMEYFILKPSEGEFVFTAPWGEDMIARPGDAIVRNPNDPNDTYRVAALSFVCTYEVR